MMGHATFSVLHISGANNKCTHFIIQFLLVLLKITVVKVDIQKAVS